MLPHRHRRRHRELRARCRAGARRSARPGPLHRPHGRRGLGQHRRRHLLRGRRIHHRGQPGSRRAPGGGHRRLPGAAQPAGRDRVSQPRFCYLPEPAGRARERVLPRSHDFAVGAGCDDLDEYKTRFEWNDDRTRFRIRSTFYRDFWPSPDFDGEPESPPENADDDVIGVRFQLANNDIGEVFDRVTIIGGQADIAGAVLVGTQSQREGILGGVIFTDDQTILDGLGCSQFHRPLEADGYPAWIGEGDPTAAPFYQEVIVDGIDFNTAAIDFSGLGGLPDSDDDLPRLLVIARGGADPASDPSAAIGVGFAHNFFGDQLFTPYVYWGAPAEVADAEVYEDDWDSEAHAPTYTPIAGNLAIAP